MGPYHWLIGTLIDEGDDFCQRLRKSVVGVLFFPTSFLVLFNNVMAISRPFETWVSWTSVVTRQCLITMWWVWYFLLRKKRYVSSPQVGSSIWIMTILSQWQMFVFPSGDRKPLAITLMLMAVLLQIPNIYLYLAFGAFLTLFSDWNTAHMVVGEPDQMFLLPNAVFASSSTNILVFALQVSLILGAVIYNFIQQVVESERRGAALNAANKMTLAILVRQRKYETHAIDDILQECKGAGVVEADLIAMYEAMNDNLKSYRPFLPNYLFQENSEEEESEADTDGQSEGDISGIQSAAESKVGGGRRSRTSSKVGIRRDGSSSGQRTTSASDTRSKVSHYSGKQGALANLLPTANHLNQRGHLFSGRITFALVDINTERLATAADGDDFHRGSASILKTVAHTVYALAKETKASVHSMLGDTVQLTWNATSSVALAETKSAVFLSRLVKAFKCQSPANTLRDAPAARMTPSLGLNAAVCSGNATVHSITADHQQALIIEAPWLPSLEGCFALAKWVGTSSGDRNSSTPTSSSGCVLMDHRTMHGSKLEVRSCPVEHVRYTENGMPSFLGVYGNKSEFTYSHPIPTSASTATMVHQLLGEHVRGDDEWMYQLETNDTEQKIFKYQETFKVAVTHISEGNFREGATMVKEIAARSGGGGEGFEVLANPVFLKALAARCAKQVVDH